MWMLGGSSGSVRGIPRSRATSRTYTRASGGHGSFAAGKSSQAIPPRCTLEKGKYTSDSVPNGASPLTPGNEAACGLSIDRTTAAFGNCTSASFSSGSSVSAWCWHTLGGRETLRRPGFPSSSSSNSRNPCFPCREACSWHDESTGAGTGSDLQGLSQITLSRSHFGILQSSAAACVLATLAALQPLGQLCTSSAHGQQSERDETSASMPGRKLPCWGEDCRTRKLCTGIL